LLLAPPFFKGRLGGFTFLKATPSIPLLKRGRLKSMAVKLLHGNEKAITIQKP